jgi:hypothetical protein
MAPQTQLTSQPDADDGSVARLTASRLLHVEPRDLCALLAAPDWLGKVVEGPPDRPWIRRVETDLAFALSDDRRTVTFSKAAVVDLSVDSGPGGRCLGHVEWRATTFAPMFPVFSGTVSAHDGGLHLEGVYAPPGGGVGLLVDRSFLHHFARRTALWFLDRCIAAMDAGVAADSSTHSSR